MYFDALAGSGVVAVVVLAAVTTVGGLRGTSVARRRLGFALAALLLTILILTNVDLTSITMLWVCLILVAVAGIVTSPHRELPAIAADLDWPPQTPGDDARGWVSLAFVGAPALGLANAILVASTGGSSLLAGHYPTVVSAGLVLIGAATAGVAPLDRWRKPGARFPEVALVSEACLPVVGLYLAARGVGVGLSRPALLPLLLLLVVGLAGIGRAGWSFWRGRGFRPGGVVERAVGFLALAAPVGFAGLVGLGVVTIGALVRRLAARYAHEPSPPAESILLTADEAAELPTLARRSTSRSRDPESLRQTLAVLLVEPARAIEERYDVAVGVLVALAVLFVFAG